MIKLNKEQSAEATRHPEGVECRLEGNEKLFIIVDADVHARMKTAFYQKDVRASIAAGLADMEADNGLPLEAADQQMRSRLGFPPRTTP
jgi:hypothetical protein